MSSGPASQPDIGLHEKIVRYLEEHLSDGPWLELLITQFGVPAVLHTVADILASEDVSSAISALTLVRDIGLFGTVSQKITRSVRRELPKRLFPALNKGLYAYPYVFRNVVVYTIGKLDFPDQIQALKDAFVHYQEKDPLLLARIVGELFWLLHKPDRSYIDRMISSVHPMVR